MLKLSYYFKPQAVWVIINCVLPWRESVLKFANFRHLKLFTQVVDNTTCVQNSEVLVSECDGKLTSVFLCCIQHTKKQKKP